MLAVYVAHDSTQIMKAHRRKKQIHVDSVMDTRPYLEALQSENQPELQALFEELKSFGRREDVCIVLPDTVFKFIDCMNYTDPNDFQSLIADRGGALSGLYYATPLICKTNVIDKRTVYAISKSQMDCLLAAAKEAGMTVRSIEAASVAFLRMLNDWQQEQCLLELFEDHAALLSYTPVAGIFKIDLDFGRKKIRQAPEEAEQILSQALTERDLVAKRTFEIANLNPPVLVLGESEQEIHLPSLDERKANIPYERANEAPFDQENRESGGMILYGTLLQCLEGVELYENLPQDILRIGVANLLPENMRKENRFLQFKTKLLKTLKYASVVLAVLTAGEFCALVYFATVTIPEDLQEDYDFAQKEMEAVKKEIALLKAARAEHQYPLQALEGLVRNKPDGMTYTHMDIGAHTQQVAGGQLWVELSAESSDPISFSDYAVRLEGEEMFQKVSIRQIATNGNGYKNAVYLISKGKVEE